MGEENKNDNGKQQENQPVQKSDAEKMADLMTGVLDRVESISKNQASLGERFENLEKSRTYPGGGFPSPNVRTGEDILASKPLSMMAICKSMTERRPDLAKREFDLSQRIAKALNHPSAGSGTVCLVPFSSQHLPIETQEQPGVSSELAKECRDAIGIGFVDVDEIRWLSKRAYGDSERLVKDLSANISTTGGTLVGLPAQGELIDLLRPLELFTRVGAQEITLPQQGSIRWPRQTSDPTIDAYGEGETIAESTPGTGGITLSAKKYSGLVDIPVELIRFATSVAVEAWLRSSFIQRLAIQTDRDMIDGTGGEKIKGIVNYTGIQTVIASTTGANGDTIEASDPSRLLASILEADARVEQGAFFAMRPNLWQGITHRRADAVSAADGAGDYLFRFAFDGDGIVREQLEGLPALRTTQVPNNRVKGSGTDLTLLLCGVGRSWIIARSGVAEIDMTTSDASKFAQGLNTMRGMVFMDAGPEHEEEFGMIDDLLNS